MKILDTVFVYRLAEGERLVYHGRYHSHAGNEFEVHYFIEGEGSFLSNKAQFSIRSNSLFLSGPHEFHSIVPQQVTKPITYYAVLFSLDEQRDASIYQLLIETLETRKQSTAIDAMTRFAFEELLRLSLSDQAGLRISADHLLASYLYRWYTPGSITNMMSSQKTPSAQPYIKKSIALMNANVRKNCQIEDIAYKTGLSTEHFIRIFREEMKMTPYQYFIRLNAQEASAVLITTQRSIAQISEDLGFENQFHFSRVFKKCTGLTPSAYRRCYAVAE